jgi:hypothetical protein
LRAILAAVRTNITLLAITGSSPATSATPNTQGESNFGNNQSGQPCADTRQKIPATCHGSFPVELWMSDGRQSTPGSRMETREIEKNWIIWTRSARSAT